MRDATILLLSFHQNQRTAIRRSLPMRMNLVLTLIIASFAVCAQGQSAFEPTSATDSKVKIHREKRWKKPGAYARVTERQGEHVQKDKPSRNQGKEARVFKRHNQPTQASKSKRKGNFFSRLFKKK
jgi:hypothetical protein